MSHRAVAVVTGAGRGIGRATAIALARAGYSVIGASRSAIELEETARQIRSDGGELEAVVTDVATTEGVARIFEGTGAQSGPIRLLINNAATLEREDFESINPADLDRTLGVNTRAAVLCAQFAFRAMVTGGTGGCIINMASLSGVTGVEKFPGLLPYVVSKFAIVGLTEALAVEGRPHNIRTICLAPGAVDTELLKKAVPNLRATLGPTEVARFILFLASEAGAPLDGLTIPLLSNAE